MPSPRETFKLILTKDKTVTATEVFSSAPVNVQGRLKMTFLVFCDQACEMTLEWSYDGKTKWYPLANALSLAVTPNQLKRITQDDVFTYLRVVVKNFAAPATLSAWHISL